MIGFYFFKLAQSIWLGSWNKEGIQNLSVVCKIRSCLIVSPSRQDRSISSAGELPLLSHNWRKKDLFSSVYHHTPFINQAWQVKMARYCPRSFFFFFFCKFLIDHNWIGPLKTQKTELDQYQGHRNLIRMYNNTYIIMLP